MNEDAFAVVKERERAETKRKKKVKKKVIYFDFHLIYIDVDFILCFQCECDVWLPRESRVW